ISAPHSTQNTGTECKVHGGECKSYLPGLVLGSVFSGLTRQGDPAEGFEIAAFIVLPAFENKANEVLAKLGLVEQQGLHLCLDDVGDVDLVVVSLGAPDVEGSNLVGLEAFAEVLGKVQTVAGGRIDRVAGRQARCPVIGMIDEGVADNYRFRIVGENGIRP